MKRILALFALLVLALLFIPTPSAQQHGTTLHVNNTVPTCNGQSPCFATIQAAVDAAQSGDTIQIQAGTYVEQLALDGLNDFSGASEADRIVIEADPGVPVGSVVLDAAMDVCSDDEAIQIRESRFVTIRGLAITGAGSHGIDLDDKANESIHIERNRIFASCGDGIRVREDNAGIVVTNNLIYGNGERGIRFKGESGGPHIVVGNTIVGQVRS